MQKTIKTVFKLSLNGKTSRKWANGQNMILEKSDPWDSSAPAMELYPLFMYMTIIVKQVYWYIYQTSGERLQDDWSSGFHSDQKLRFSISSENLLAYI